MSVEKISLPSLPQFGNFCILMHMIYLVIWISRVISTIWH
uniref:Uncharacterized protein n=1 Tax=Arundo donax TaxID=35708 RepID=A0A0A8ZXF5_ARUDO